MNASLLVAIVLITYWRCISLRPHTLEGHMALYKAVLHHGANSIPKWLMECIAVFVSHYNNCAYCVDHHLAGLKRLLEDDERYADIARVLRNSVNQLDFLEEVFTEKEACALRYSAALTTNPVSIDADIIKEMRNAGLSDAEILEINQIAAYFAYANRTALGLGVVAMEATLGLSPSDSSNPNSWKHK